MLALYIEKLVSARGIAGRGADRALIHVGQHNLRACHISATRILDSAVDGALNGLRKRGG